MNGITDLPRDVERLYGAFLREHVAPDTESRDEAGTPIDREVLREAGRIGLLGASLPTEVGGGGRDLAEFGRIQYALGRLCDDTSFTLLAGLYPAVAQAIHETGRADLVERYVRPMARGERLGSFAYTEDADAFALASAIRREGAHVVLDGEKRLVTGGLIADTFMTYVRAASGDLVVVLLERDDPGVEVQPIEVSGLRGAGLARLVFRDTRVEADRVMVERDGLSHVQAFLNRRRALLVCAPLGHSERLLDAAVDRLLDTVRYGEPLAEMQSVRSRLGRMYIALSAARAVIADALHALARGEVDGIWDPRVSAAKHFAVEQVVQVAHDALRLAGGRGYMRGDLVERLGRDLAGLIPGGGAQDILEVDLGTWLASERARQRARAGHPEGGQRR